MTAIQIWTVMPANESDIVTLASDVAQTDATTSMFWKLVLGILYFISCALVPPVGFTALSCCILKLLMERLHPPSAAIPNDPSIYRRYIRPVGRTLVLVPLALIISIGLVGLGFVALGLSGPIFLLAIPALIIRILIGKKERNQLAKTGRGTELPSLDQSAEPDAAN